MSSQVMLPQLICLSFSHSTGDNVRVNPIIQGQILDVSKGFVMATLFNAPLIFVLWKVKMEHRAYREAADDSIRELPLRPPGESLRQKISSLVEEKDADLVTLAVTAFVASIFCFAAPASIRSYMIGAGVGLFVLNLLRTAPKLLRITRQLWNHQLRYVGEQLVAEELNQLLNNGYRVFHDVPCQGYNIDHVIVGPTGVFAIETNTHRKPKNVGKRNEHRVRYDGDTLFWPVGKETGPVDQALFNGRSLAHWLGSATGEPVRVQPIVTIPGWKIEDNHKHRVWVLKPQTIRATVESQDGSVLPDQIQRISHQMAHRCRLEKIPLAA